MNIKKLQWFWGGGSVQSVQFIIPDDFDSFFSSNIYRSGSTYTTDYDFEAIRSGITGNTAYVDVNAPGGGDGSIGSPYNSLSTAISNTGFKIYKIRAGNRIVTTTGFSITRELAIEKYDDGDDPLILSSITTSSWSVNGSFANVYEHSNALTSLTVGSIVDQTNVDINGKYVGLNRVSSIANVSATANTFFYDATADIVYVRTFDDRAPDSDIVCLVASTTLRLININSNSLASNAKISLQNIKVWGANPLRLSNNSGSIYWNFGINNCEFSYAGNLNGCLFEGYGVGHIYNTRSDYNLRDGFNYVNSIGFSFEWNCRVYGSTLVGSSSDKGSTSREGWKTIRVAGDYQYTRGKGVQDINDVVSYSLGCTSKNSLGATEEHRAGFASNSSTGTTTMYLIECTGPTDHNKFWNLNNSVMNIYDGSIGNLLTGTNKQDPGSVTNTLLASQVYV